MLENLICMYRWQRRQYPQSAASALSAARARIARGEKQFTGPIHSVVGMGAGKNNSESDGLRWIEDASDAAGRLVGFADEVATKEGWSRAIDHKGWFTTDEGDSGEVMRGVVYRLPHGRGFLAGYAQEGFGDDGGARLDCHTIHESAWEAAKAADRIAERCAESERDYQAAASGGIQVAQILAAIPAMRAEGLALCAERRRLLKIDAMPGEFPQACGALSRAIRAAWHGIQEQRREAATIREETRHRAPEAFQEALAE